MATATSERSLVLKLPSSPVLDESNFMALEGEVLASNPEISEICRDLFTDVKHDRIKGKMLYWAGSIFSTMASVAIGAGQPLVAVGSLGLMAAAYISSFHFQSENQRRTKFILSLVTELLQLRPGVQEAGGIGQEAIRLIETGMSVAERTMGRSEPEQTAQLVMGQIGLFLVAPKLWPVYLISSALGSWQIFKARKVFTQAESDFTANLGEMREAVRLRNPIQFKMPETMANIKLVMKTVDMINSLAQFASILPVTAALFAQNLPLATGALVQTAQAMMARSGESVSNALTAAINTSTMIAEGRLGNQNLQELIEICEQSRDLVTKSAWDEHRQGSTSLSPEAQALIAAKGKDRDLLILDHFNPGLVDSDKRLLAQPATLAIPLDRGLVVLRAMSGEGKSVLVNDLIQLSGNHYRLVGRQKNGEYIDSHQLTLKQRDQAYCYLDCTGEGIPSGRSIMDLYLSGESGRQLQQEILGWQGGLIIQQEQFLSLSWREKQAQAVFINETAILTEGLHERLQNLNLFRENEALAEMLTRNLGEVSKGQRQRFLLARAAFWPQAELIIADEPLSGIQVGSVDERNALNFLISLTQAGRGVVMISHEDQRRLVELCGQNLGVFLNLSREQGLTVTEERLTKEEISQAVTELLQRYREVDDPVKAFTEFYAGLEALLSKKLGVFRLEENLPWEKYDFIKYARTLLKYDPDQDIFNGRLAVWAKTKVDSFLAAIEDQNIDQILEHLQPLNTIAGIILQMVDNGLIHFSGFGRLGTELAVLESPEWLREIRDRNKFKMESWIEIMKAGKQLMSIVPPTGSDPEG